MDGAGALDEGQWFYRISATVDGEETYGGYRAKVTVDGTNDGENAVRLTWPALPDATEYHVYRVENANDPSGTEALLTTVVAPGAGIQPSFEDDGSGAVDTDVTPLEGSPFLPTGSLSEWVTDAQMFASGREGVAAAVGVDGVGQAHLYAFGGFDGVDHLAEVRRSAVQPDGILGAWTTSSSMTMGRSYASVAVVTPENSAQIAGTLFYVVRGLTATGDSNSVEGALMDDDPAAGDLTVWAVKDGGLGGRDSRHGTAAFVTNDTLYIAGGFSGTNAASDVDVACIVDAAGTLDGFAAGACGPGNAYQASGGMLASPRGRMGYIRARGHYVVSGGHDGAAVLTSTERVGQ